MKEEIIKTRQEGRLRPREGGGPARVRARTRPRVSWCPPIHALSDINFCCPSGLSSTSLLIELGCFELGPDRAHSLPRSPSQFCLLCPQDFLIPHWREHSPSFTDKETEGQRGNGQREGPTEPLGGTEIWRHAHMMLAQQAPLTGTRSVTFASSFQ